MLDLEGALPFLEHRQTKWVFASRVLQSDAGDIAVSGSLPRALHAQRAGALRQERPARCLRFYRHRPWPSVFVYAWRPLSRGGWCTAGHASAIASGCKG